MSVPRSGSAAIAPAVRSSGAPSGSRPNRFAAASSRRMAVSWDSSSPSESQL